jgi:hypothetical protein
MVYPLAGPKVHMTFGFIRLTLRAGTFAGSCQKGNPYPSGNARNPFRAPSR